MNSLFRSPFRDLAANLGSGVRLAFWRSLTRGDFRFSSDQLALLAVLQLLLNFAVSYLANGPEGYLDWEALPSAAFPFLLLLAGAVVVAKIYGRDALAMELPIVLLTPAPVFTGVFILQELLDAHGAFDGAAVMNEAFHLVYLGWIAVVFVAALLVVGGRDWRRLAVSAALLLGIATLPQAYFPYDELWVPQAPEPAVNHAPSVASEEVLNLQPRLLARELGSLAAERRGVVDLYFIGFAPNDGQDVFMKEIQAARELMEQRFDARGRAVTLVNNPETLLEKPIATVSHLAAVLERVGEVMNPQEDILFLFLTSHGLPSQLEVRFHPLSLRQLYPGMLRQFLDAAGIKWRVIVISACYSGSFVGPLQDDRTLIITAAGPENTSFGCSSEADFTYFGRAFFGQHLRTTYSFEEAYRLAAVTVSRWEKEKGYQPSQPQMQIGAAMAARLRAFEARLRAGTATAAALRY